MHRGIRGQQSSSEYVRLPITINLLQTLKSQLRTSQMSLLEQYLLWTAFMLWFYGLCCTSELVFKSHMVRYMTLQLIHMHHTAPIHERHFWRGQSIHIYTTSTTCLVRVEHSYNDMLITKQPHHLVFSGASCPQLTTIIITSALIPGRLVPIALYFTQF